jgi:hypothetical protein
MQNIDDYFSKNKFSLSGKDKKIDNIEKNACLRYAIDNSYEGLKYYGDKNKCMLFKTDSLKTPINHYKNYKIKTYIKTKDIIDIEDREDQSNSYKYLNEINNNYHIPDNLIDEFEILNEKECIDSCVRDNDDCKTVIYLEQPKSCIFYNKKNLKKPNDEKMYDIYTLKNLNEYYKDDKTIPITSININSFKNETNNLINTTSIPLYNCSGLYSTNPFCTSEFDPDKSNFRSNYINYTNCINDNDYDNECKKKYGNEYIFDNDLYNLNTIVDCDNGGKKVKCKLDFENFIEKFENYEINYNNRYILIFTIILIIIIILLFIYIK